MKHFLILLALLGATTVRCQKIEKDGTGRLISTGVITVDSVAKDVMYDRAMEWIALNYKSGNDVLLFFHKESGKIISKGSFSATLYLNSGWINYTLLLEFRDNRFKYTYSNFTYSSIGSDEVMFDGSMFGKAKAISTAEAEIAISIKNLADHLKSGAADAEKW